MRDDIFQGANNVFRGKLRRNKKEGNDVSQPKCDMLKEDLEILNNDYFIPGLEEGNTEVLLHKIFFDLMFHTGRRAKEGLQNLTKYSFDVKKANDKEYIQINFNEVTKKNQGDSASSALNTLHNDHAIIVAQKDSVLCPVNCFKHYISNLND